MRSNMSTRNMADPKLLDKIDKLFELGVGEYIRLPQVLYFTIYLRSRIIILFSFWSLAISQGRYVLSMLVQTY